jgi:hypothetical protein
MIARGTVTEVDGGGFVLRTRVGTGDATETQTIEADTCAKLADAYALIVAFAIDPGARVREDSAAPQHESSPVAHPEPESGRHGPGVRGVFGPLAAAGAGFMPFPALGVGARIRIESTLWWELAGTYWPGRLVSVPVDRTTTVGAHITLISVEPGICLPVAHRVGALCAETAIGTMPATGTGMAHPGSGSAWWLAPALAAALRTSVGRVVDLGLRLEGGVQVLRPSFVAYQVAPTDPLQVYRPAEFFGILSVEAVFPFFSTESGEAGHVRR